MCFFIPSEKTFLEIKLFKKKIGAEKKASYVGGGGSKKENIFFSHRASGKKASKKCVCVCVYISYRAVHHKILYI